MDRGELFKKRFEIIPASEGGFIISPSEDFDNPKYVERWAFSNIDDLMEWVSNHAVGFSKQGPQPPEGDRNENNS